RKSSLEGVRDVIERRVNSIGVSEPLIQTMQAGNSWRVTVELAGVRDIHQAIKLIGETPILEFKEQNDQTTPVLTLEQKKQIEDQNREARKKALAILAEARKPGANFQSLTVTSTEPQVAEADILQEVKDLPAGTVLNKVLDRPEYQTIVKVDGLQSVGTQIQAHHLLIGYAGAQGNLSTYTKEQAKAKIEGLKQQATVQNFDTLVTQNSQEPGAVESKGDLGWFGKGDMVEDFEKAVFAQPVGTISDVVESPYGFHLIWKIAERPQNQVMVRLIEIKKLLPQDVAPPVDPWKATPLTGKQLKASRVDFDQQTGQIQVSLQFNDEGAKLFGEITKRNIGKPLAIFLDGQLTGNPPTVQTEILGGQAVITGNYSLAEAKLLAQRLQAGALPVPIKLIAQQTVGPTLGADS
ncbi:MAG: peptidylprolyl isomerase, partial [Candidatus Uhrbacteria bacterium]|nr:peptidylprolyl isomerase [Candidatus Uhrbacteria bacterium]